MATYEEIEQLKLEKLREIKADYHEKARNGFTIREIIELVIDTTRAMVEIVERADTLTGDEKNKLVVENIRRFYEEINPDLPGIPEPLESFVERVMLKHLLPAVINSLVKIYNENNIFKHRS